jgi:hypothetical protein
VIGPLRPQPAPAGPRRQSGIATRRQLRQWLSRGGRKWVKGVWQAADQYSLALARLSPVSSPVGTRLTDQFLAEHNLAGEEARRAVFLTLVAGYSTRAVLAEPTGQPRLDSAPSDDDGLEERVRAIAAERFESIMTLPPEVWRGYLATATMNLQGRLTSTKFSWKLLDRDSVETLLRWGYVLRCLDEVRDAEPVLQETAP